MNKIKQVESLCRAIDARSIQIATARRYDEGTSPLTFLSPESKKQLGDRLSRLEVNYCLMAKEAVSERLKVQGFSRSNKPLGEVWSAFTNAGGVKKLADAFNESFSVGQSFVSCWAGPDGKPSLSVESPQEMSVERDPLTHTITSAVKRWRGSDGKARAVLYRADDVTTFVGPEVPMGGVMPSTGWSHSHSVVNVLGVCPVVELTNSSGLFDVDGTPVAAPIYSLTDALTKVATDVLVSSESTSLPRRWATGVQLEFDPATNEVIPPFNTQPGNVWLTEKETAKFGQFPEANLASYNSTIDMLIRQIGALASLPDGRLGLQIVDPSSAEGLRASETAIVSKAYSKMTFFGEAISRLAALIEAILNNSVVRDGITVDWTSPESLTYSQTADAVSKLHASGLLPWEAAMSKLGYRPDEIESFRRMRLRQAVETQGVPA